MAIVVDVLLLSSDRLVIVQGQRHATIREEAKRAGFRI
jgi:hypothetical protein